MGGLSGSLSIAVSALQAEQAALDVTSNNVANANTPGYSRQRPDLVESNPVTLGPLTIGTGVTLQQVEGVRDPLLENRIQQETQQQGMLDTLVPSMQQVEVLFNQTSGGDIGTQISNFFSSVSQLSANPQNLALRTGVLTAAGNLANSFHTTANNLSQQRSNLDLQIVQGVGQINTLTTQIAQLNGQIGSLENLHQNASAFLDQRGQLINQLANLVDVAEIHSENGGLTLTMSNGTPLVAGNQSFALNTQPGISGLAHIFSSTGADITGSVNAGELAGWLQVRDQKIPALLSNLDTLASGLASGLNAANHAGFDLNGLPGTDLFTAPPANGQGYGSGIAVQITDPSLIAASSDGAPGSNGNVASLLAVADQAVANLNAPNVDQQETPSSAGPLNANDVLTVGEQTSVTAVGTTFTYTNAVTSGANPNQVTGATAVTPATVLASGDVLTLTRGGKTTIYTATAATTVANLITAINRGVAGVVAGTNFTVSGSDPQPNHYQAVLAGGNLQIVDLNGNNDLTAVQNTGTELGAFTTNAAATSTLQDLINAINGDATVGATAGLVGGKLVITDPQNRGDLAVTTTDTLLGAAVAGVPTAFTTPNTSSGQTPTDFYSNLVFGVGNDVAGAQANQTAAQLILNQLQDQRGSVSGVSLDEEASNLLLYQRAFDAAARLVTTVDEMMQAVINMKT